MFSTEHVEQVLLLVLLLVLVLFVMGGEVLLLSKRVHSCQIELLVVVISRVCIVELAIGA